MCRAAAADYRPGMARHEVTVDVPVPPARVLEALADPAALAGIDSGIRSVEVVGDPTVRTGLTTRAVHAFYGRDIVLDHELVELSDRSLVRTGRNRRVRMEERVAAEAVGTGSRVTLTVDVALRGLLKPLDGGLTAVLENRLTKLGSALGALTAV
jgi:carbon monoxide dehydrogenase subunit G